MSLWDLVGITSAFAQEAATEGAAQQPTNPLMWILMIVFMVVFYFLLIRPQSKRAKEHRKLVTDLQKGDEIVTSGGIVGTVVKLTDTFIVISAGEQTELTLQRNSVAAVLPKGTLKGIE